MPALNPLSLLQSSPVFPENNPCPIPPNPHSSPHIKRASESPLFYASPFINVAIHKLGTEDKEDFIGISGRFVKNTTLEREQIFDQKKSNLVTDYKEMESAPSALFTLILNNHRLLYVKETNYAPSINEFGTTVEHIIKKYLDLERKSYFDKIRQERKEGNVIPWPSKDLLSHKFPKVDLSVTPLASQGSLNDFIKKFKTIERVQIKLLKTNHEIDYEKMFGDFRDASNEIGSTRTSVEYQNKEGLDSKSTSKQLENVVKQGNHSVALHGKDENGDKLDGNNDTLKLKTPIRVSKDTLEAGKQMFKKFIGVLKNGLIIVPQTTQRAKALLEKINTDQSTQNKDQSV